MMAEQLDTTPYLDESGDYDYKNSWQHPEGASLDVVIDAATEADRTRIESDENTIANFAEHQPSDEDKLRNQAASERLFAARKKLRELQEDDAKVGVFHGDMEAARAELNTAESVASDTHRQVNIGPRAAEAQSDIVMAQASIERARQDAEAAYRNGARL